MGLDIYFYKFKKADWKKASELKEAIANEPDDEKANKMIDEANEMLPDIQTEIGYFRKVNFLMAFFNYEGNCEYKEITRKQLRELKDKCFAVYTLKPGDGVMTDEIIKKCSETLPTQAGFFFGNTNYDEWYFQEVKEVLEWVSGVLEDLKRTEVVLMYCWW